jgi:hypothetical protein
MKQPIAGLSGIKPRPPKPEGNGKLSRAKAHRLDAEYRRHRNRTLELKNTRETMLLQRARGELLSRQAVEAGLSFVLVGLRSKILQIHQSWSHRLVNLDLVKVRATLSELELSLLAQLRALDPDHPEHVAGPERLAEEVESSSDDETRDNEKAAMRRRETPRRKATEGKQQQQHG